MKKKDQRPNQTPHKEGIRMERKHLEKMPTSYVMREKQNKTII